jgi:hypothetical protein
LKITSFRDETFSERYVIYQNGTKAALFSKCKDTYCFPKMPNEEWGNLKPAG